MQRSFFEITPVELGQLGSEPAVAVLRAMLYAEANNVGIAVTDIDVPFAVTTPDGGVDGTVKAVPKNPGNGLIFGPITSFQVKAGDFVLSPTSPGQIEALLMTPSAIGARRKAGHPLAGSCHKPDGISPRIRACLDVGGTFVVMLFGDDNPGTNEDATENAIRQFLGEVDSNYKDAKIRVWRQSKICGLLRSFPAVSLQIKNLQGFQLLNHDQWSNNSEMRKHFEAAPEQLKVIESLRIALRDDSQGMIHVRLIGEPGIGKTRLVLETLRANDFKWLVLYADKGSKVDGSVISAIHDAKDARVILVVDECGPELRSELTRTFDALGSRLKIVSIYQDPEEGDRSYRRFDVPVLPVHEIEAILLSYGVDPSSAKGWAELCDGSPRVAHVVGQNLREEPADPLKSDATSMIWVRYLAADVERTSEVYRKRHLVVSSLALFKRFGWAPAVRDAAYEIYDLIVSQLDSGLSKAEFGSIIQHMIDRKVLQGDHFLYITPRAFHVKLWIDWWHLHGVAIKMKELVPKLSTAMRQWFGEMIEYASAAPVSKKLVVDLLGPQGLYVDAEWLKTKEGARFFFSLSLADPFNAMKLLERTIGKMGREELLTFGEGRRDVIWALEGIALRGELFRPAARLLLALAEAENETWSNNASGVFAGLFSLGYGELAPTSLAPEHRLPILTEALDQGTLRAMLALRAFEHALSLQSITRWGGDEPFRLGEPVKRWLPKTNKDWWDAYKLYWTTLSQLLQTLSHELRHKGAAVLLSRMRELLRMEHIQDDILETVAEISAFQDFDKREIISEIELVLHYDTGGLPDRIVSRLGQIRDDLVGVSFESRLKRYVGMNLLQDEFDRHGQEISKTADDIRRLAEEALQSPEDFNRELAWLVTTEAKNGYRFGYTLSEEDVGEKTWPQIAEALAVAGESASDYFAGGYLHAIFDRDKSRWEQIVLELANNGRLYRFLPGLVWRSGMTETVAMLILDLAKSGHLRPQSLGVFSMGRATSPISDGLFDEWLDYLIEVNTFEAAATALNLSSMSLLGGRELTAIQIQKVITQPSLFERGDDRPDVMLTHYWLQLSKALIKIDTSAELVVLRCLLENIGNSGAITASLGPEGDRFLDDMVSRHPTEMWRIIAPLVRPPMNTRGFVITRWLRGDSGFRGRSPGPMRHIPRAEISKWIEADPERRAAYIANMAPKDFDPPSWQQSLVRDILCRFGDSEMVRSAVFSNFFTGGWNGPASSHYATEKEKLVQLRAAETNPNALRWLDEAINATDANLERAKIEEEARGF